MEKRLVELEIKVAYLEKAHDELNEVVRELFNKIAIISRNLEQTHELAAGIMSRTVADEKPPHY